MFTTIMYGFINEVTRQPGGARIPLRAKHDGRREHSVVRPRRKVQPPAATTAQRGQVAGKVSGTRRQLQAGSRFLLRTVWRNPPGLTTKRP